MIPAFHDYPLEPKITKCGDLLYYETSNLLNHMSPEGFSKSLAFFKTTLVKISVLCIFQGQRSSDISDWFIDYT